MKGVGLFYQTFAQSLALFLVSEKHLKQKPLLMELSNLMNRPNLLILVFLYICDLIQSGHTQIAFVRDFDFESFPKREPKIVILSIQGGSCVFKYKRFKRQKFDMPAIGLIDGRVVLS